MSSMAAPAALCLSLRRTTPSSALHNNQVPLAIRRTPPSANHAAKCLSFDAPLYPLANTVNNPTTTTNKPTTANALPGTPIFTVPCSWGVLGVCS
ncbi:hypothetical protein ACN38_g5501 [Penicillium nordicum]|uniref:Uncharacterized protein n=1 Tax=Penicillium nordicum TaxID=229535 RepID=A0A0M9WG49_9EURO|nr:hypothetical protein ACN38_g5501 [Penicillium nordicum]